jgi:hypothetical protein
LSSHLGFGEPDGEAIRRLAEHHLTKTTERSTAIEVHGEHPLFVDSRGAHTFRPGRIDDHMAGSASGFAAAIALWSGYGILSGKLHQPTPLFQAGLMRLAVV